MSIKLHNLMKEERSVTFEYEDEKVTIKYRPAAITPQMQSVAARMQVMGAKSDDAAKDKTGTVDVAASQEMNSLMYDFVDMMCVLIASWEIIDEDGKELPVKPELAMRMPLNFLMALFKATMDDMRPNAGSAGS